MRLYNSYIITLLSHTTVKIEIIRTLYVLAAVRRFALRVHPPFRRWLRRTKLLRYVYSLQEKYSRLGLTTGKL